MFIPFRASIKTTRLPVMTLVVAVVCLLVYWAQHRNIQRIEQSAVTFCANDEVAQPILRGQQLLFSFTEPDCPGVLTHFYLRADTDRHLALHQQRITEAGDSEAAEALERHYRAFAAQAPGFLTQRLWHNSGSWNPLRLLTSVISHGGWDHVIGNLFFFIAFGMVVETVIGPVLFLLVFLAMALGSGALENMITVTREGQASLGLSGVVMSVMALAAWFAPRVKIRFFFFYFLFFGVISWPLWAVAGWYVFWNLWNQHFWGNVSHVNYVAHLAGAVVGLVLGLTVFRSKRHWAQQHIVRDEPTLKDEESWLYKLNTFAATPVVAYFIFFYGMAALLIGMYLLVTFMKTFAAQLLIVAPVVAGLVKLYQLKQPKKPDRVMQEQGLKHLARHEYQQAEKILLPLAKAGHTRSQHAMGLLYATAPGLKNIPEAIRWYQAAAERGLPEAQYELGTRYYHGLGLAKDLDQAIGYLERAAQKGLPEAASTLGHLYENAPKGRADREKSIEWYYKAGVGYHKAGRHEDAAAVIKTLQHLADKYPAVYQLIGELERLVHPRNAPQPRH